MNVIIETLQEENARLRALVELKNTALASAYHRMQFVWPISLDFMCSIKNALALTDAQQSEEQPQAQAEPVGHLILCDLLDTGGRDYDFNIMGKALEQLPAGIHELYTQRAAVPDGYVLVPINASLAMLDAAIGICGTQLSEAQPNPELIQKARNIYAKFIETAPIPPTGGAGHV